MADAPPPNIFELGGKPGIRRDGTDLASDCWQDAQWVRFQRGRPRKMGGYSLITDQILGPVRAVFVDSRASGNTAHTFSTQGIERTLFSDTGDVTGISDRTPAGFVANADYTWQAASMFQSGGAGTPTLIACATPDGSAIASDTAGSIYSGDVTGTAALTAVSDGSPITVSGGICVLQPFLFVYGSNGLIRNSNPNDISAATGWTLGGANYANIANVSGSKIVKGLPMRGGGQSPSGVFWALDALIRVTFVGGTKLWSYDTVSDDVTILSKNSVCQFDNTYFWIGIDRFFVYDGVARELPNDMNLNWFFDNLNFAQRQKVWALKVPRWGEIWWFFPSGSSTECDQAVIFNVRQNTWYDTRLARSAGFPARVFASPVMTGELVTTTKLTYTPTAGAFSVNEQIRGLTSSATGTVARTTGTQLNLINVTGTFVSGESIIDTNKGGVDTGTLTSGPTSQSMTSLWRHEYGTDRVVRQNASAIQAYAVSSSIQWMTGGPLTDQGQGYNFQTRLLRVEPDFIMSGGMTLQVTGAGYAQSTQVTSSPVPFTASTEYIDLREQRRELALRFESNTLGGTFQMGKVLLTAELGDERG
jgi:hypothetical protein